MLRKLKTVALNYKRNWSSLRYIETLRYNYEGEEKKRVLEMCYSSGCTHPGIAHHWLTKAAKKSFASLSVAESKAVVEAHQLQQHLSFESWFHKVHWIWKDGNFVETQESCARYSTKNLEAWTCVCRSLCLWGHSTDHQSQPTGGSLAIQTSPSHWT